MEEQDITKRINELVLEYKASGLLIDEFLKKKLAASRKSGKKCAEAAIDRLAAIDKNFAKLQEAKAEGKNRQEWIREKLDVVIEAAGADKKRDVVGEALSIAVDVVSGNPPKTKQPVSFDGFDAVDIVASLDEAFWKSSVGYVATFGKEDA